MPDPQHQEAAARVSRRSHATTYRHASNDDKLRLEGAVPRQHTTAKLNVRHHHDDRGVTRISPVVFLNVLFDFSLLFFNVLGETRASWLQ